MTCPRRDHQFPEMIQGEPISLQPFRWGMPVQSYHCPKCHALTTLLGATPEESPPCQFCKGPTCALKAGPLTTVDDPSDETPGGPGNDLSET